MPHETVSSAEERLVLLAEDDEDLRVVLGDVLEFAGYVPLFAADGLHALEVARHRSLHAAVVDLHLPGLSGLRVVSALRERDPALCLIVMSGAPNAKVEEGVQLLEKPFPVEDLLAALSRGAA